MDIRLFSFTSLLIGLFCTSSWASNHNRNSGKNVNLRQDSIPSNCLIQDNVFNSSSNPTFLTIKPRDDFWMNVYLRLYDHSNGEQSISEGLYDRIFVLKGTGEERYQSFQVKIAALQDTNWWTSNTNWWGIDVSTESQNIDISMTEAKHYNGWTYGHAFHSMIIEIELDGVRWNDTKCWAQNRDVTTTATTTPRTTTTTTTLSTTTLPATESSTKQSGSTTTATESSTKQSGSTSTATESSTKQSGSTSTATESSTKQSGSTSTATESSTKQSGSTSTATESSTKQSGSTSTPTESSTKQSGRTSTATESSTKQSGSTSTQMQEVEGRVQRNKNFDFVKFFFF